MSYSIEKLSTNPIVILTANVDAAPQPDLAAVYAQLKMILDQSTEPLTIIQDVRRVENVDLDTIIRNASDSLAFYKHPHMGMSIIVTSSEIFKAAAEGLNSNIFNNQKVMIFDTIESAIAYAREN
jgi:hypothetical protein